MRLHFKNFIAVIVLVAVVYFVTNYAGQIQQQVGVKGASTSRAKGIAGQVLGDATSQVNTVEKQVMQMKISDIMNGLSRFQRVPQDVTSVKEFVQTQVNNVLESRNKKK